MRRLFALCLALTTCAADFTHARTVVLARMEGVTQ